MNRLARWRMAREDIDRDLWESAWRIRRRRWLWEYGTVPGRIAFKLFDDPEYEDETDEDVVLELISQGILPKRGETDDAS